MQVVIQKLIERASKWAARYGAKKISYFQGVGVKPHTLLFEIEPIGNPKEGYAFEILNSFSHIYKGNRGRVEVGTRSELIQTCKNPDPEFPDVFIKLWQIFVKVGDVYFEKQFNDACSGEYIHYDYRIDLESDFSRGLIINWDQNYFFRQVVPASEFVLFPMRAISDLKPTHPERIVNIYNNQTVHQNYNLVTQHIDKRIDLSKQENNFLTVNNVSADKPDSTETENARTSDGVSEQGRQDSEKSNTDRIISDDRPEKNPDQFVKDLTIRYENDSQITIQQKGRQRVSIDLTTLGFRGGGGKTWNNFLKVLKCPPHCWQVSEDSDRKQIKVVSDRLITWVGEKYGVQFPPGYKFYRANKSAGRGVYEFKFKIEYSDTIPVHAKNRENLLKQLKIKMEQAIKDPEDQKKMQSVQDLVTEGLEKKFFTKYEATEFISQVRQKDGWKNLTDKSFSNEDGVGIDS